MYFAIKDYGVIKLQEVNGDLENTIDTSNEIKIIKTKVDGKVKVYILLFNEVTDSKSLIMAHGGKYLEDKLVISDEVDSREYKLEGAVTRRKYNGDDDIVKFKADKCKFVEFPLIDELLKLNAEEVTQFVSCLEVIKNSEGNFLEFIK